MERLLFMDHISKSFPGVKALDDVNIDIYPGEVHALVGENGAGKSTLMKILNGVYQPDKGNIFVNGEKQQIGLNENAVMGIATAIEERGLAGEIIVTGVDCSVDVQAYLRQGVIQGTSTQDPYKMGYMAVYGLQQVINGEDLNHAIIDTGSAIVTAENIDDPEIQAVINPK